MAEKPNRSPHDFYDADTSGSYDHGLSAPSLNDQLSAVNQNITKLDELQTLSELAEQLQNTTSTNVNQIKQITRILKQSEILYIDGLTENLNDREKIQAAELIANIISQNPYLHTLSLESNQFDPSDMARIIGAVVKAKSNTLLKSELKELHLQGSIQTEGLSDFAGKLQLLRKKYSMVVELDRNIDQELTKKQTNAHSFFEKKVKLSAADVPPQPRKKHNN
jgi:hypothetical protein